jgi:ribose 5-phosphate isomerase B
VDCGPHAYVADDDYPPYVMRAALAWTQETAQLARQHNDANVLSLGARMYPLDDAMGLAQVFVAKPFSGEPRHARRLAMIADYEKTADLPPAPAPEPVPSRARHPAGGCAGTPNPGGHP